MDIIQINMNGIEPVPTLSIRETAALSHDRSCPSSLSRASIYQQGPGAIKEKKSISKNLKRKDSSRTRKSNLK